MGWVVERGGHACTVPSPDGRSLGRSGERRGVVPTSGAGRRVSVHDRRPRAPPVRRGQALARARRPASRCSRSAPGRGARLPAGGRAVPVLIVVIGWGFVGAGRVRRSRRPDNPHRACCSWPSGWPCSLSGLVDRRRPAAVPPVGVRRPAGGRRLRAPAARLPDRAAARPARARRRGRAAVRGRARRAARRRAVRRRLRRHALRQLPAQPAASHTAGRGGRRCTTVQRALALALVVAALALVVRRWRRGDGSSAAAFAPLLGRRRRGLALGALSAADAGPRRAARPAAGGAARLHRHLRRPARGVPASAWSRSRFFRTATVGQLLGRLTAERRRTALRGALAAALGDPSVPSRTGCPSRTPTSTTTGARSPLPPAGAGAVATEIVHQGRRVGVLVHDAGLADDPRAAGRGDRRGRAGARQRAARGRAARPRGGAARVARPHRRGRRRRAPAARPRPARRRPAAARRAADRPPARARARGDGGRARGSSAPRSSTRARPSSSCASWPRASTPPCCRSAAWTRRSRRWPRARRCPWSSTSHSPSGCPRRSRRRPTSSWPRRSPTSPSTPGPPTRGSASGARRERVVVEVVDDGVGGAARRRRQRPARPGGPGRRARRRARGAQPARPGHRRPGPVLSDDAGHAGVIAEDQVLLRQGSCACSPTAASTSWRRRATPRTCCARWPPTGPTWRSSTCRCRRQRRRRPARRIEIRAPHPDVGVLVLSQFVEQRYAVDLLGDSPDGASATCSRTGWPTSRRSPTRCAASARAARRSTRPSWPRCSAGAGATTRSSGSRRASATCSS